MEIKTPDISRPPILLDLAGVEECEALLRAFKAVGLDGLALGAEDGKVSGGDLASAIRKAGAEFAIADGALWADVAASLPRPPRDYLVVLLLDPSEEATASAALASGAFDYVLRDGPGWESRVAAYCHALSALLRRIGHAFGNLERRYENLVHALPDIVYELDEEGRFTFINNSVRLLGYEPSELAGQHFSVLLHEDDARAVDRDEVLRFFSGVKTGLALSPKLFNERRGLDRRTENLEIRLRKKAKAAGEASAAPQAGVLEDIIATVTSYGEVTAVGEYGREEEQGEGFSGSVGVLRDITLRRKSEEMLRKLYQSVDQLSSGVLVADRAFSVEYVNPAFLRMSGREPQEIIGASLFGLFDFGPGREEEARSLMDGGFELREEARLSSARGQELWVAFHASPVRSPQGDVTHVSVIVEDVSHARAMEELLKLAKEEAERANRAKSDFLASMSHELRSPVTGILAAARLIEMGSPDPERRARSIIQGAEGLLGLLGDVLDFVRFETGSTSVRKFVFPLGGFIERCVEPYRAEAAAKGLAFELGTVPEEEVYSDPDRLGRALGALLDNAVTFTDRGSVRLDVRVERRGGNIPHLLFTIADTGIGIPAEDQARIFAPFVQLQTPYNKTGGAGIGLSLARNIVRALGGEVRLDSEPGHGSTFTVLVPSGEAPEPGRREEPATPGRRAYRLLVVDDNEVNLDYMAAILGGAGHVVDRARSGAEALQVAEERPPDAAILDIQMPGMSGIELERRLRAYAGDSYDPGLPLLALTAFDPQEVLGSGARFAQVFSKPFDAKLLARGLDRAVDEAELPWFGCGRSPQAALVRAREELPDAWDKLADFAEKGNTDAFRTTSQAIAGRLETMGATAAASALRRLGLAFSWEDRAVVESRILRFRRAWERSAGLCREEGAE